MTLVHRPVQAGDHVFLVDGSSFVFRAYFQSIRQDPKYNYRSDKLPRMDELKDAPTRPPDEFEAAALEKLRAGADLHVGDDGTRFLGAVRSAKQCVECHGGERGALLGAFSYRLRPAR